MKKLLLAVIFTAFSLLGANAQESAGITAGYSSLTARLSVSGGEFDSESGSESVSGFFIGVFKEFELSDKFNLKTELAVSMYKEEGENSNILLLPVLFKYKVTDGFSLLFGPQLDYILDDDADGMNKFGLGIGLGLEMDLSKNIFINAKYALGVSERIEDDFLGADDIDLRFDYLTIGLGYRF